MFYLHTSNKTEHLFYHLAALRKNAPRQNPFEREIFLIQSEGMRRWLSQQLARYEGIFCHYQFYFPNPLFAEIARTVGSNLLDTTYERDTLLWRIETVLREEDFSAFPLVSRYLEADDAGVSRFQLAAQLAALFDQYQIARPGWLDAWEQGTLCFTGSVAEMEAWQAKVWQAVRRNAEASSRHRGELWREAIHKVERWGGHFTRRLPRRLFIFGINILPEVHVHFLQALARHCEVHLFLLNPCELYWSDIDSRRRIVSDNPVHHDQFRSVFETNTPNPLLASLGHQGKYFQEMLLTLEEQTITNQFESFAAPDEKNLLNHLQYDLLYNAITIPQHSLSGDRSVCVHSCHTPVRELEVLRDEILHLLSVQPDLHLRDIVVMAPDIEVYTPYISTLFRDMRYSIADAGLANDNPLVLIFQQFLQLLNGRLGWQTVMDLLALPEIYQSFGLTLRDVETITEWVQAVRVRWGRDAEHHQQLGLPREPANTWQAGMDRMFFGYVLGAVNELVCDVYPYADIEGGASLDVLTTFYRYLRLLFDAHHQSTRSRSLREWQNWLRYYAEQFFCGAHINRNAWQTLADMIMTLESESLAFHQAEVSFAVIQEWLGRQSREQSSASAFLSGGLTFCSMLPMRAIPFEVIALLGMNEGAFPGRGRHTTFDLLQHDFRKGDRSKHLDDKYQFLELLLCARRRLMIFYQGQLAENNQALQPSSVVSELLEVATECYHLPADQLEIRHPLKAYDPVYFDAASTSPYVPGYDPFYYRLACRRQQQGDESAPAPIRWWPPGTRADLPMPQHIATHALLQFGRCPQHYFVRYCLEQQPDEEAAMPEETEPFRLDPLEDYQLRQQIFSRLCRFTGSHQDDNTLYQHFRAQGVLPGGIVGYQAFAQRYAEAEQYYQAFQQLAEQLGEPCSSLMIDTSVATETGTWSVEGILDNQYEHGQVIVHHGALKGKTLLQTWLRHVLLNYQLERPMRTCVLYGGQHIQAAILEAEHCVHSPLQDWIALYLAGHSQPSVLLTEPAMAYALQRCSKQARKSPLKCAREAFDTQLTSHQDAAFNLLYGDWSAEQRDALFGEEFSQVAEQLVLPVYQCLKKGKVEL